MTTGDTTLKAERNWLHRWSSNSQILAGFAVGAAGGIAANVLFHGDPRLVWVLDQVVAPVGEVFLRMIFMIIIPLIISAFILGVTGLQTLERLKRIGVRYALLALGLAVLLVGSACLLELALRPGDYVSPPQRQELALRYGIEAEKDEARAKEFPGLLPALVELIPDNPVRHLARALTVHDDGAGLPSILIFSLFFSIAILVGPRTATEPIERFFQSLFAVSMNVVSFGIKLTPFCIVFIAFDFAARLGLDLLSSLGMYLVTFGGACAIAWAVIFPLGLKLLAGRSPIEFYRQAREPIAFALVTSSSSATYPVALRAATERLAMPPSRVRFVLTLGAVANQTGSAMFFATATLFLADIFGVGLSPVQRFQVFALSVAFAFATPGVPGGSLPLLATICLLFGIPPKAVALVVSIDPLLDRLVTGVNVTGDLVLSAVLTRGMTRDTEKGPALAMLADTS